MSTDNQQIIRTAAVIGAGSMGSGIAAHLANAGVNVHLLDIPAEEGDRDARARAGVERQVKQRGFMDPEFAARVTPGNIEDHLDRLGEAEWIVEAVFEDLDVKHQTFAKIAAHRAPGTPVSSNTSTIPLAQLTEGMDADLLGDFAIIHFFNPPRVMRLVELVAGPQTSEGTVERLRAIAERQLGKVVVDCRDTPGFIANRVGNFWMSVGAALALDRGVRPELADTVFGKPFGVPRTGTFGLFDYVGLQLVPAIWGSLLKALPESDAYHRFDISSSPELKTLLDKGLTGRTGESGFYRGRGEVYDFAADDYRPIEKPDPAADPAVGDKTAAGVIATDSEAGRYARDVYLHTLAYCCAVADEIADTVEHIDLAIQLGYGWKRGPFALADAIGLDNLVDAYEASADFETTPELLSKAVAAGGFYPAGPAGETVLDGSGETAARLERAGVVTVAALTADAERIAGNDKAEVFALTGENEGVAVLTINTPMSSCHPDVLAVFREVAGLDGVHALVIAGDDERVFSAGADLGVLSGLAAAGEEEACADLMRDGVSSLEALRRAPFPVVGAVRGVALGGGLELLLHTDASAVHAETRLGFPEREVGLFPAWGGTARTLERAIDSGAEDPHAAAFELIMSAKKIPGAFPARAKGVLRPADRIVLSSDHVIAEALDLARELAGQDYSEPGVRDLPLRPADAPALEWTEGSETDARIGRAVAAVYTAGEGDPEAIPSDELTTRETAEAAAVLVLPANAERAAHMAKTRRPLKN